MTIRLWDAVALRDRFPALQARRAQIATAEKNLAADLASADTDSAAVQNLKTKVLADPSLTGDSRTATMIVLREVESFAELINQPVDELEVVQPEATPITKPATLPVLQMTAPTAPSITAPTPASTPVPH